MIDCEAEVRKMLAGSSVLAGIIGARIYMSRDFPKNFELNDGPALKASVRGGSPDYTRKVLSPSIQIQSYGRTDKEARSLDKAVFDCLDNKKFGYFVMLAHLESLSQLSVEPETHWPFMLAFYTFTLRNP